MNPLKVFISSTIDDLSDQRDAVDEALSETEVFDPVRVEKLAAKDDSSRHVCLSEVAESDAVILLLSDRYGFIPEKSNPESLSVTHLEYRQARRHDIPVFVFIKADASPEATQEAFITEVSDFDEGVLRKAWESTEELASECRRALLLWILSKARDDRSGAISAVADVVRRFPEASELQLVLEYAPKTEDKENWCNELLHNIESRCADLSLPLPRQKDGTTGPTLKIAVEVSDDAGTVQLSIGFEEAVKTAPHIPTITIKLEESEEGLATGVQCVIALVLYASNDLSACIECLIKLASEHFDNEEFASQILWLSAFVSAIRLGEKSLTIVEMIVELENLESHVVGAGIMALFAAQVRLSSKNAKIALRSHDELMLMLLTVGISKNPEASELLYNLGRKMRAKMPMTGLKVFERLVELDPTYDERWYFHRDVGSIYYDASDYLMAGEHYDQARNLKDDDSELHRHAGDAYYYPGHWAKALVRYRKAIDIDPVEQYFVDTKIAFLESRARIGAATDESYVRYRGISHRLSNFGIRLMGRRTKPRRIARPLFVAAKRLCGMNCDADRALALFANRRGNYSDAVDHLESALQMIPENPLIRLDLALNLILAADGEFTADAKHHVIAAIFHGGPAARDQFRLRLTNTENRDELLQKFDELFELVKTERDEWLKRRSEVTKPEMFGHVMHVEH